MKILITGPESSGKSTLTKELSTEFKYKHIPEYARTYLTNKGPAYAYTEKDLLKIAKEHYRQVVRTHSNFITDTFLLNLKVWSMFKYNNCDPWILKKLNQVRFDKVLLLKPNIPWAPDPLRETPDQRDRIYKIFKNELEELGFTYYLIDAPNKENRLFQAISAIKD